VDGDDESYYRAVKTCMLLSDWADEVPDAMICERYGVGPGDIYAMVESVNWLLHAAERLARMFAPRFSRPVQEYEICMRHGIRRDLLPLIRLKNIGRVRARRLFNNGITDPDLLRAAGSERIAEILGRGIAQQLFEKQRDSDEQKKEEGGPKVSQPTLSDFGDRT
jgi:helicase